MANYAVMVQNSQNMVHRLMKHSGVEKSLVQSIVWFSRCLIKPGTDVIDGQIFSVVMSRYFGMAEQSLLMKSFYKLSKKSEGISIEQFACVLCTFYSPNLDVQIDYVFHLYDLDGNGTIDMVEVHNFIKSCKCVTDMDEAEKDETYVDLCAMALETLGIPNMREGICLEAFRAKVKENILILAILGQHIPSTINLESFKAKIQGKTNLQMQEAFGSIRNVQLFEPPDKSKYKYYPITLDFP